MKQIFLIACTLLLITPIGYCQNWAQRTAIEGDTTGDHSGFSVALSSDGNAMAIGVRGSDNGSLNAGEVKVMTWNAKPSFFME